MLTHLIGLKRAFKFLWTSLEAYHLYISLFVPDTK